MRMLKLPGISVHVVLITSIWILGNSICHAQTRTYQLGSAAQTAATAATGEVESQDVDCRQVAAELGVNAGVHGAILLNSLPESSSGTGARATGPIYQIDAAGGN